MSYSVLPAGEAFWRPSNQMGVAQHRPRQAARRAGAGRAASGGCGPGRRRPSTATTRRTSSTCVLEGEGRIRIDEQLARAPAPVRGASLARRACGRCSTTPTRTRCGWSSARRTRRPTRWRCRRRRWPTCIPTGRRRCRRSSSAMTDRLHFTGNDEADRLIVEDPFALLVGFALDQQVPVPEGVHGAVRAARAARHARRRRGRRAPTSTRSSASGPAIHRFPGAMATRVHELAVHVLERYDGRRRARLDRRDDDRRAAREPRRAARVRRR